MDPVTIITSVSAISKAAVSISTTLFTFIDATQNVDKSIQAIYDGIKALNQTLNSVRSTLESSHVAIGTSSTQEQNSGLWAAVVGALDDCRVTVEKFKASLTGLEHEGSNVAVQARRAFKLQYREEGLRTFTAQVQTHNAALQLILQIINIHVNSAGPGLVIESLSSRIELLVDMIGRLDITTGRNFDGGSGSRTISATATRLESLVISAQQMARGTNPASEEHGGGSAFGGQLSEETQSRIDEWIRRRSTTNDRTDAASISSHAPMTPSNSSQHSNDETEVGKQKECESDDEFEFEEIEAALRRGNIEYNAKNFVAAELFFNRACTMAKQLSLKRRNSLNLRDVQLKIALCFFHQARFDEAEVAAVAVREGPRISKDDRIRALAATHLIAEIFCQVEKLENAQGECRNALIERRKLFGKDHLSYLESLSLLSVIKEKRGDYIGAAMDQDMIPADVADPLLKQRRERKIVVERPKKWESWDPLATSGEKLGDVQDISSETMANGISTFNGEFAESRKYCPLNALVWACWNDCPSMVHLLLTGWSPESLVDLTISASLRRKNFLTTEDMNSERRWFGQTPLHIAAKRGNQSIAAMLLDAGTDADTRDDAQCTPLHIALQHEKEDVVRLLLSRGANIVALDAQGDYPPIYRGTESSIRFCHSLLLEKKSDSRRHRKDRETALVSFVLQNLISHTKMMLEFGVNPWKNDRSGHSAIEIATEMKRREIMLLFKKAVETASEEPSANGLSRGQKDRILMKFFNNSPTFTNFKNSPW